MKKQFVQPETNIIRITNDVIRTSVSSFEGSGQNASGFPTQDPPIPLP